MTSHAIDTTPKFAARRHGATPTIWPPRARRNRRRGSCSSSQDETVRFASEDFHRADGSDRSPGTTVLKDPVNGRLPSAIVMSLPLARSDLSLARKPATTTSAPTGSDLVVKPRLNSAFGGPPSII